MLPVAERDHIRGNVDAPAILVKYGNYQNPDCGRAHLIVEEIRQSLGERLCFVFRHFPQVEIYAQSQKAAEVAECAAAQSKFWEMHDILFEHQHALDDGHLVEYVANAGLDINRFLREMSEHMYADRVQSDYQSGIESGVTAIPTFFINGIRHHSAWDRESLLAAITTAANC
jgi:protein-disulfide isomerase